MRALLVDDDPILRLLLEEVCKARGYEVTSCPDAESALQHLQRQRFELVLVDWLLPGISGLELCRKVRLLPGSEDTFIIVITSRDAAETLREVLVAGADDYCAKPFTAAHLTTRLTIAERSAHQAARRRQAEQALRRSQDDLQRAIQSIPVVVIIHHQGKIIYCNPASVTALGRTHAHELCGQPLAQMIHPEDRTALSFTSTHHTLSEVRLVRPNGEILTLELIQSQPIKFEGQAAQMLVANDVTERKKMQAQLLLNERMASVGTLAAGVAHEINNPLAYVLGNLTYLSEELIQCPTQDARFTAPQLQEYRTTLAEALDGARRVSDIIDNLKMFARTDDAWVGPVDVNKLLEVALNVTQSQSKYNIEIRRRFGKLPHAKGNHARMGQVFLHLILNALQALEHTENQPRILSVSTALCQEHIVVQITDNGVGIPPKDISRVFDPFFTTRPVGLRTGLGLFVCHSTITSIGGTISVQSDPHQGTTFRIELPRDRIDIVPTRTEQTLGSSHLLNLLIVDDEPQIARTLERALHTHNVTRLSNPTLAIPTLQSEAFDLIFCDLAMPNLSGYALYKHTLTHAPHNAARFVFLHNKHTPLSPEELALQAQHPFLAKPFDFSKVYALIYARQQDTFLNAHPPPPTPEG